MTNVLIHTTTHIHAVGLVIVHNINNVYESYF